MLGRNFNSDVKQGASPYSCHISHENLQECYSNLHERGSEEEPFACHCISFQVCCIVEPIASDCQSQLFIFSDGHPHTCLSSIETPFSQKNVASLDSRNTSFRKSDDSSTSGPCKSTDAPLEESIVQKSYMPYTTSTCPLLRLYLQWKAMKKRSYRILAKRSTGFNLSLDFVQTYV
jgi:hypothetical protein